MSSLALNCKRVLFTCISFVKTICTCVFVCMRACDRVCVFLKRANGQNKYQRKNNALNSLAQTSKHSDGIVCVPSCLFDALPFRPIRNASLHMRKFLFLFYVCYNTTNSLIIEGNDENNTKATVYNAWKYQEGSENAHKIVKKTQEERTRIKKNTHQPILNERMQDTYSHVNVCVWLCMYWVKKTGVRTRKESCILQSSAIKTQKRYEENWNKK